MTLYMSNLFHAQGPRGKTKEQKGNGGYGTEGITIREWTG